MTIKFIVARHNEEIFNSYLNSSLNKIKEPYDLYNVFDTDTQNSMFSKYNFGIEQANPQDDDIIVFAHEDVRILDENLIPKLELIFKKKPDVGLVGIVGTKVFDGNGWWSNDYKYHVGAWHQEYENKKTSKHMIRKIGFDDNMLIVDGCFFAVRGKVAKEVKFLDKVFGNYFHFYDYSYSLSVLEAGWKVAVADISILHRSEGQLPPAWHEARQIFRDHYVAKGYTFPLSKEQIKKS
jgi:GT2 family glycosyltransferase